MRLRENLKTEFSETFQLHEIQYFHHGNHNYTNESCDYSSQITREYNYTKTHLNLNSTYNSIKKYIFICIYIHYEYSHIHFLLIVRF